MLSGLPIFNPRDGLNPKAKRSLLHLSCFGHTLLQQGRFQREEKVHGFKAFIVERQREGESREVEAGHGHVERRGAREQA